MYLLSLGFLKTRRHYPSASLSMQGARTGGLLTGYRGPGLRDTYGTTPTLGYFSYNTIVLVIKSPLRAFSPVEF